MGKVIQFNHNNKKVYGDMSLIGKHNDYCLCYRCNRFRPESKLNCFIAERVYGISLNHNVVIPVFECPEFVEKKMERCKSENNYPYMSVEESDLYDKAFQNQFSREEANLLICKLLEEIAEMSQGDHQSALY